MTLQLHEPDDEGGLRPAVATRPRTGAPSCARRAGAATSKRRLPTLKNPEMNPTSRFRSVLFWAALGALTFGVLVVGYGIGFWT